MCLPLVVRTEAHVMADDGSIRTLLTETDAAYLDAIDDWIWLDGDQRMTWLSERTGWRHVYSVDRRTGELTAITSGDWEVVSVELIDEDGGWIYFMASPHNATQRYLYRVPLAGGDPVRLSQLHGPSGASPSSCCWWPAAKRP